MAPSILGLAGVYGYAQLTMDGRSIVPLLVDVDDPTVPSSTRAHIRQLQRQQATKQHPLNAAAAADETPPSNQDMAGFLAEYKASWRTFHPIEFW